MRPATLRVDNVSCHRLRLAAERAVKACGPIVARYSLNFIDPEVDEARGSLMDLAKALETR